MKISARNLENTSKQKEIIIKYKDQEIAWDFSSAYKNLKNSEFDVFQHFNAYMESLPEEKVDAIFSLYTQIRLVFDEVFERNRLTQELYPLVSKLMDQFDLANVQYWIMNKSDILIPDRNLLEDTYIASPDRSGTRQQTYIREDYIKLISMCLVLRAALPVWGEYITKTHSETGTKFKEQDAFKLISSSHIMQSEAMKKLEVYVEYATLIGRTKPSSIIGGVSSEDFPDWILSLVVIKRLCVIDIRGLVTTTSIPSQIYGFIDQKIKALDASFNGTIGSIKNKPFDKESPKGDQNISRLEAYKAKQKIPPGDIVALEFAAHDAYDVANKIVPGINPDLVTSALKTAEILATHRIYDPQIVLMQWVTRLVIPARSVDYFSKQTVIRMMSVTQAVLWHHGHKDLAALSTAMVQQNKDEMQTSSVDSRGRIPKEMLDELNILFPFFKRPAGKQKAVKIVNRAVADIDYLAEAFSAHNWMLTIESKYLKEVPSSGGHRRFMIPHNIKVLLANLVLDLANRRI